MEHHLFSFPFGKSKENNTLSTADNPLTLMTCPENNNVSLPLRTHTNQQNKLCCSSIDDTTTASSKRGRRRFQVVGGPLIAWRCCLLHLLVDYYFETGITVSLVCTRTTLRFPVLFYYTLLYYHNSLVHGTAAQPSIHEGGRVVIPDRAAYIVLH